jgi:hypothetical protein
MYNVTAHHARGLACRVACPAHSAMARSDGPAAGNTADLRSRPGRTERAVKNSGMMPGMTVGETEIARSAIGDIR